MGRHIAAVILASSALLAGCKGKPEKICENLQAIVAKEAPDKPLTEEDKSRCVADIKAELEQCQNAETIASCYVEATSLDAVATCQSKCAKKAPPRPRPGASASPDTPTD